MLKTLTIEIPEQEWLSVLDLAGMTDTDESNGFGWLLLKCENGLRRWAVGTPHSLSIINGSATDVDCLVPISRRLVQFAASESGRVSLVIQYDANDAVSLMSVIGRAGRFEVAPPPAHPTDYFSLITKRRKTPAGITVDSGILANALHAIISTQSVKGDLYGHLDVSDGVLTISADIPGLGITKCQLDGDSVSHGSVQVELNALHSLVRFHPTQVCLHIPIIDGDLLYLNSDDAEGMLAPIMSIREQARPHVEDAIVSAYGKIALYRDHDDDYRLVRRGTPVFGRLIDSYPTRLQVFAVLLDEIEATPELYEEMNDYNVALGYVRVTHMEGQVWAVVDLVAESMTAGELKTAVERITSAAEKLVPMLQLRFGGESSAAEDVRWESYIDTVVMAEVQPGKYVALNGPNAVKEWPFEGPVHVITAWDPQGVHRSTKENEIANQLLAGDLLALGLHFVRTYGVGMEDHDGEPGFAVWGSTYEDARRLGASYDQDAIFEISATKLLLISCFDDRVFTKERFR